MGDLGDPGSVVKVADAAGQKSVWDVRTSGLNIMMSMKSEGKPVSFIEDCAVPLEHLADYTERLTAVFEKHGTRADASHVRLCGAQERQTVTLSLRLGCDCEGEDLCLVGCHAGQNHAAGRREQPERAGQTELQCYGILSPPLAGRKGGRMQSGQHRRLHC